MTTSEHIAELRHASYLRHRDVVLVKAAAYREANRDAVRMRARVRQANRRYPGEITSEDVLAVFERGNRTCVHCGKAELSGRDLTIEHLRPVNDVRFIAVSCFSCNAAKIPKLGRRKTPEEKAALHVERERARVRNFTDEQREHRRAYMREYKRKRKSIVTREHTCGEC